MSHLFPDLFTLRRAIARIGQADWLAWWDCHALSPTGDYVVGRLFRRTPQLSAAHIAFLSARAEHRHRLPKERLIHLFDFGEAHEGAFERWLIARKSDGWTPDAEVPTPTDETKDDPVAALKAAGVSLNGSEPVEGRTLLLETVEEGPLEDAKEVLKLAWRLAAAYGASQKGTLVAPYVRVRS